MAVRIAYVNGTYDAYCGHQPDMNNCMVLAGDAQYWTIPAVIRLLGGVATFKSYTYLMGSGQNINTTDPTDNVFDALAESEVDLYDDVLMLTEQRMSLMNFATPHYFDKLCFSTKKAKFATKNQKTLYFLEPMSMLVWIVWVCSVVAFGCLHVIAHCLSTPFHMKWPCGSLIGGFILAAYTSNIREQFIVVHKVKPLFASIGELADLISTGVLQLAINDVRDYRYEMIYNPRASSSFVALRNALSHSQLQVYNDATSLCSDLLKKKLVVMESEKQSVLTECPWLSDQMDRVCPVDAPTLMFGYAFSKTFKYGEIISRSAELFHIIDLRGDQKMQQKFERDQEKHEQMGNFTAKFDDVPKKQTIMLNTVSVVFLLVVTCWIVCIGALMAEILCNCPRVTPARDATHFKLA